MSALAPAGLAPPLASRARQGASDGGTMHLGLLLEGPLEFDADAAARGVSERLLGLVGEVVAPKTVNEEQIGYGERASMSAGADTKANWGGGALELDDLRLLEDSSERGGALGPDVVPRETARGWAGAVREQVRVNGR